MTPRTSAQKKARQLARYLRDEQPDYAYLKRVFYYLRQTLGVEVPRPSRPLPVVPDEQAIRHYYEAILHARREQDLVIFKTLLYTGVRVSELVAIRLDQVDLDLCQIHIVDGKGHKDRVVPFPSTFRELLTIQIQRMVRRKPKATFLFESTWQRAYTSRGIHKLLAHYAHEAGLPRPISPHKLRHFLLLWLKKQGLDDALIQPYSGHASRQSLEVYSRLAIQQAQQAYDQAMENFPL
jgi:integrase/recombinase XerD